MSKSKDLREAAVIYQKEGHTYDETAKVFGVVKSTVHRWVKQYEETGDLSNKSLIKRIQENRPGKAESICSRTPWWYTGRSFECVWLLSTGNKQII